MLKKIIYSVLLFLLLVNTSCEDTKRRHVQCSTSSECSEGICFKGKCYEKCDSNSDCSDNTYCIKQTSEDGTGEIKFCDTLANYIGCSDDTWCETLIATDECETAKCMENEVCSVVNKENGVSCSNDDIHICYAGRCMKKCEITEDCDEVELCVNRSLNDEEEQGLCENKNNLTCEEDAECLDVLTVSCKTGVCNNRVCDIGIEKNGAVCDFNGESGGCFNGECYKLCTSPDDCDPSSFCTNIAENINVCIPQKELTCESDNECSSILTPDCRTPYCNKNNLCGVKISDDGEKCFTNEGFCYKGNCYKECDENFSCPDNKICVASGDKYLCIDELSCETDSDCGDVATPLCKTPVCKNQKCTAEEVKNGISCGEGKLCYQGECLKVCSSDYLCQAGYDCIKIASDKFVCTEYMCMVDEDCNVVYPQAGKCEKYSCNPVSNRCTKLTLEDGTNCDDGDLCNGVSICVAGNCVVSTPPVECEQSQSPCIEISCNPDTGLCEQKNINEGLPCDDNNECTKNTVCKQGVCTGGEKVCDNCQNDADCIEFDDGNFCNGISKCVNGICVFDPDTVVTCEDDNPDDCVKKVCEPQTGECIDEPLPDDTPCNVSDDLCAAKYHCKAGECVIYKEPVNCDTDNPCEVGECNPQTGFCEYKNKADGSTCSPDQPDLCTNYECYNGKCVKASMTGCIYEDGCIEPEAPNPENECEICSKTGNFYEFSGINSGGFYCNDMSGGCFEGNCYNFCDGNECPDGYLCYFAYNWENLCIPQSNLTCNDDSDCKNVLTSGCEVPYCNNGICDVKEKQNGDACENVNNQYCYDQNCYPECKNNEPVSENDLCVVAGDKVLSVPQYMLSCKNNDDCAMVVFGECETVFCNDLGFCQKATDSNDTTCGEDKVCYNGSCVYQCDYTEDCPDGLYCYKDFTITRASAPTGYCIDYKCNNSDDCFAISFQNEGECKLKQCNQLTSRCEIVNEDDGTLCDNGDLCDGVYKCQSGECIEVIPPVQCEEPQFPDCSFVSCNPNTGKCESIPINEGELCDDGNVCTEYTTCNNGVCTGGEQICTNCETDDDCTSLDNGNLCDGIFTCKNGICEFDPSTIVECDSSNDTDCMKNLCDKTTGQCNMTPVNEGEPCNVSQNLCDGKSKCENGECVQYKPPVTCPEKTCYEGLCNPQTGECEYTYVGDGEPCTVSNPDPCGVYTCYKYECMALSQKGCEYDGKCYAVNEKNPDDPCQVCKQAVTFNGYYWQTIEPPLCCHNDYECDDYDQCTIDKCQNNTCTYSDTGSGVVLFDGDFSDPAGFNELYDVKKYNDTVFFQPDTYRSVVGKYSIYFGNQKYRNFNEDSKPVSGSVTMSDFVKLQETENRYMFTFSVWMDVDSRQNYDVLEVSLIYKDLNGNAKTILLDSFDDKKLSIMKQWARFNYDITEFQGLEVKISFLFKSKDKVANSGEGIYLDDIKIIETTDCCQTDADCKYSSTSPCLGAYCDQNGMCKETPEFVLYDFCFIKQSCVSAYNEYSNCYFCNPYQSKYNGDTSEFTKNFDDMSMKGIQVKSGGYGITASISDKNFSSKYYSLYFGNPETMDYYVSSTPKNIVVEVQTAPIPVVKDDSLHLSLMLYMDIEMLESGDSFEIGYFYEGAPEFPQTLFKSSSDFPMKQWKGLGFSISSIYGESVVFYFKFKTNGTVKNHTGIFLDNLTISYPSCF